MTKSPPEFWRCTLSPAQVRHLQKAIRTAETIGDLNIAWRLSPGRHILIFPDYEGAHATLNLFRAAHALAQHSAKKRAIANAIKTMETGIHAEAARRKQAARGEALSALLGAKI